MIWVIPTTTDVSFTQETTLDGVPYRLTFRWNEREEFWYLTVADIEDTVIAGGLKLVPGVDLLRYLPDNRPPGDLLLLEEPNAENFGTDAVVAYADEDE